MILLNLLAFGATTIAAMYRPWQVELFFKSLNKH